MSASVGRRQAVETGRAVGWRACTRRRRAARENEHWCSGSAKSLDGRDAAAANPHQASPRRPPSLPAEDGAQEHAQHRARETRVEGELVAHRHRHGEHPLADGHGRQDAIDQVRGEFAHAPPAARRTEPAATAAEGHHRRVPAALTLHAQQTVFEPATLEVRLELAPHERRPARPVLPGRAREERREVRRDRPVEHGLLGLAALIGRPRARDRAHGPRESRARAATARGPTRPCGRAVAQWPSHAAHARSCSRRDTG